jgi:hypothetical protein
MVLAFTSLFSHLSQNIFSHLSDARARAIHLCAATALPPPAPAARPGRPRPPPAPAAAGRARRPRLPRGAARSPARLLAATCREEPRPPACREEPPPACLPRVAARLLAARSRRSPVSQPRPTSRPRVLAARRSPNRVRPRGARSGSARPR